MNLNEMAVNGRGNGQFSVSEDSIVLTANGNTDWFYHPSGASKKAM